MQSLTLSFLNSRILRLSNYFKAAFDQEKLPGEASKAKKRNHPSLTFLCLNYINLIISHNSSGQIRVFPLIGENKFSLFSFHLMGSELRSSQEVSF